MNMKKYKVTYEYRGKVTVEVEAEDEKQAERFGLDEADECIAGSLMVYDTKAEEL